MADIIAATQQVQAEEIDTSEVLREYGLEDAQDGGTVVQNGNTTITIPTSPTNNGRPSSLEPPPVGDINEDEILRELGITSSVAPRVPMEDNPWDNDIEDEDEMEFLDDIHEESNENEVPSDPVEEARESFENAMAEAIGGQAENGMVTVSTPAAETPANVTPPAEKLETEEALKYLIPVNTKAVEVDETTSRFNGAAWFSAIQQSTVVMAGMGGIGSYALYILSRMKPLQIFIYDDDVVERVNLSGQLYSTAMIGKKKVNAMAQLAKDFSEYNGVIAVPTKFTNDTAAGDIMICGFDNMPARKTFFNAWVNHVIRHKHPEECLFIDGRLNMEEFQVFCIKGDDSFNIKKYANEYLFEDWQAESVACSMKQTTYCANMIGSVIVNLFTNFISNTLDPVIPRDLPFKTYYDASMMYFKTEN